MEQENTTEPKTRNALVFPLAIVLLMLLAAIGARTVIVAFEENSAAIGLSPTVNEPRFVPESLSWVPATSSPPWGPRDAHALALFRDRLWLSGGIRGDMRLQYWEMPHLQDLWASRDGIQWELISTDVPWGRRRSMNFIEFRDSLIALGGWEQGRGYDERVWSSSDGISWSKIASSTGWGPREGQAVAVFNGKIWMAGGVNFETRELKNDVWYSEDGIHWTQAIPEAPWGARYDHTLTSFGGRLWLAGGLAFGEHIFRDLWVSEDGTRWERVFEQAPWPARHGHGAVVFRDMLWLIGGWGEEGGQNDTWFSPDGTNWHAVTESAPWKGREDLAAVVFHNAIWMLGGMNTDWQWEGDIWVSQFE